MVAEEGPPGQQNLSAGPPPSPPRIAEQPAITFISIESASPARDFWVALVRLVDALREAAVGKGAGAR
jgi:hypothetical protein